MPTFRQSTLNGVLLGAIYTLIIVFVPWEEIRGGAFADLQNYIKRIQIIQNFGVEYFIWESTPLGLLKFEALWFMVLVIGAGSGIEPETFLKLITAFSAFAIHRYLRNYLAPVLAVALLINPITIDLLSSQIRSAFAFALFLTAASNSDEKNISWTRMSTMLLTPFVHTGMTIVLLFYFTARVLAYPSRLGADVRGFTTVTIAVGGAIVFAVVAPMLAEAIGDRRNLAAYPIKSPAYVLFWLGWAIALAVSLKREACRHWRYFFALMICLSAGLMELSGSPGFRFIALSVPIIFSTLPLIHRHLKTALAVATPLYSLILFAYWAR